MMVYIYTFPNNKKYIGQTTLPLDQRAQKGRGYKRSPCVYAAIQKYGWDNIIIETITCNSEEEMDQLEIELIAKYKTTNRNYGYNLDSGGHTGHHLAEETKQKLREKHLGMKASEETKQKMSESHRANPVRYWKGKKLSEEHKKRISLGVRKAEGGMRGKKHTEETKQKMRDAKGIPVICLETEEIYPSAEAASQAMGLSKSSVGRVICGKSKTSGGFHWMKLSDYQKLLENEKE